MENYAAHIRDEKGKRTTQTVSEHCRGTAKLAEKYSEDFQLASIAKLQALIHDAGKLCKDFNGYICGTNEYQRGMIDHCYAGARYLVTFAKGTRDPKIVETAEFIARTVISHHGLHDWLDENGEWYFFRRIEKDERYDEIEKNIRHMISENEMMTLLQAAVKEYAQMRQKIRQMSLDKKSFAFYMGQFERLMQSVLIDADRTDTASFQLAAKQETTYGEEIWEFFYEKIETKSRLFGKRADKISQLRSSISDRCRKYAEAETKICRMIVPTGGGKTLSSIRFAINYCKIHHKKRIFYIAPFMSILEQNSEVLKEIVGEENLLEHHSDMASQLENAEEIAEYELRSDKWDMPVIATTLVQFMNTLYSDRLASVRRMHRLCNAVIIIDEVQSVPAKCVSLFNMAMNFLSEVGGSCVVLCSATQPTFENTAFPLKLDSSSSMTGDYSEDFLAFRRTEIVSAIRPCGYSYLDAAGFCAEKFKEKGNVLFVVNTKKAALSIYQNLKEMMSDEVRVLHISTSMCPEHRRKVIGELKDILHLQKKVICVTTQLIEAGVDISFHCVIRSLAGLDNAAQAAGRCNRNGEYHECCKVFLLNLNEERLGALKEIRTAQHISRQIVENNGYPELQSVETMKSYFDKFYQEERDKLGYNVEDNGIKTDLLDLLSLNHYRKSMELRKRSTVYTGQAFKTAGQKFEVIENKTISVIIPYNEEAKRLISCLQSDVGKGEMIQVLRRIQRYIVEIYNDIEQKLKKEHAIEIMPCGVYVLDERYYDSDRGVMLEGTPMDMLMF